MVDGEIATIILLDMWENKVCRARDCKLLWGLPSNRLFGARVTLSFLMFQIRWTHFLD